MKKSFFEDLPARKKPAHVPADGTPDGVDSNEAGMDEKKVRQAVYDIRYRAKREDVELEQAMSQYFSNTTMTGPEKDAVKAKLFGEGYGLVSQQIWSDTMELEERAKGTGRDRKYRVRVKAKVSGRTYARWANREKISQLRANPSIGAQGVEMSDAGKAYEGDDDDAGKTKEAPKAKKDDKQPTKKEDPKMKKEEYLDETGKRDQAIRDRIKMFKKGNIEHTPPRNWDPEANRGQGATVSPKQAEKRRRKALRTEEFDAFDVILEFLIDEEIAQDIQEANWIMANAITEEQIDEILGMFTKKAEKKTEYAGRSMKKPVPDEKNGYTVDKSRPEVSVSTYGKGGKTDKFKTKGGV